MNIARYWLWLLVMVVLFASSGLAERLPLQKKPIDFKFPEHYEKWYGSPDPKTGLAKEHDPKPRLVPLDEKSARYAFTWIGVDGKEKQVIYERPDAIEVVVAGSVKEVSGRYQYIYKITNLPSSGQRLTGFVVQYFSSDTVPAKVVNCYIGKMFHGLTAFKQGEWIRFAPIRDLTLQDIRERRFNSSWNQWHPQASWNVGLTAALRLIRAGITCPMSLIRCFSATTTGPTATPSGQWKDSNLSPRGLTWLTWLRSFPNLRNLAGSMRVWSVGISGISSPALPACIGGWSRISTRARSPQKSSACFRLPSDSPH